MRYLKPYKIFEDNKLDSPEIKSLLLDLEEILLEVKDIGFDVSVGITPMTLAGMNKEYVELYLHVMSPIQYTPNDSNTDLVKESLLRSIYFMKDKGWDIDFVNQYPRSIENLIISKIKNMLSHCEDFISIELIFKKSKDLI